MTATDNAFRVWVGCLACYNAGYLIGEWSDADVAGDLTTRDLHAHQGIVTDDAGNVRGAEMYGPHEELWVMDLDNAPDGCHREMSPCEAQQIAERLAELDDDEAGPFAAWCANAGETIMSADVDDFRDSYAGEHDTFRDYADELVDDMGVFTVAASHVGMTTTVPDSHPLRSYFDYDAWARDLILGGDYWTSDSPGGVYVFRSS